MWLFAISSDKKPIAVKHNEMNRTDELREINKNLGKISFQKVLGLIRQRPM